MLCPMKVNSNTIELTVHTSCYCVLDLLCVNCSNLFPCLCPYFSVCIAFKYKNSKTYLLNTNQFLAKISPNAASKMLPNSFLNHVECFKKGFKGINENRFLYVI